MAVIENQVNEIKALQKQKQVLIDEIDKLEKRLVSVKGKITLQCGTEIMIEPQFHLKLDSKQRIGFLGIYAILDNAVQGRSVGMTELDIGYSRAMILGREGPCQVIELYRRSNAYSLD